jgi:hypothetical protein
VWTQIAFTDGGKTPGLHLQLFFCQRDNLLNLIARDDDHAVDIRDNQIPGLNRRPGD